MSKAWLFLTASTLGDLEAQESFITERCKANGIDVAGKCTGVTEASIYDAIENIRKDAQNNGCEYVAAMNISAFGQGMNIAIPRIKYLMDAGFKIFSATEGSLDECLIESYALRFTNRK